MKKGIIYAVKLNKKWKNEGFFNISSDT